MDRWGGREKLFLNGDWQLSDAAPAFLLLLFLTTAAQNSSGIKVAGGLPLSLSLFYDLSSL
jgi:hypothetical protein